MDSADQGSTRKFPGMTLAELIVAVQSHEDGTHPLQAHTTPGHVEKMRTEIARRKSGASVHRPTPQI